MMKESIKQNINIVETNEEKLLKAKAVAIGDLRSSVYDDPNTSEIKEEYHKMVLESAKCKDRSDRFIARVAKLYVRYGSIPYSIFNIIGVIVGCDLNLENYLVDCVINLKS